MEKGIQAIIGLGNPGSRYANTRHNVGFWFVDLLSRHFNCSWRLDQKLQSYISDFKFDDNKIRLFKPTTYMNLSGKPVSLLTNYYKISKGALLVIHDDIDLDVGVIKFKFNGGHGGHNGLRSIIQSLGDKSFYRLRIGVGRPIHSSQVEDYVLQAPTKSNIKIIEDGLHETIRVIPDFLSGDYDKAMKELHTRA